jgi:hypothetical protein
MPHKNIPFGHEIETALRNGLETYSTREGNPHARPSTGKPEEWIGALDCLEWGAGSSLNCYFTEIATGKRSCVTVRGNDTSLAETEQENHIPPEGGVDLSEAKIGTHLVLKTCQKPGLGVELLRADIPSYNRNWVQPL